MLSTAGGIPEGIDTALPPPVPKSSSEMPDQHLLYLIHSLSSQLKYHFLQMRLSLPGSVHYICNYLLKTSVCIQMHINFSIKNHQKSINTTEFIYRKLRLVKISFLQDPLQIHRQLLHGFSPRSPPTARSKHQVIFSIKNFFYIPTSYPSQNSGVSPNSLLTILPNQDLSISSSSCPVPSTSLAAVIIQPALPCQKPLNRLLSGAPDSKLTPTDPSSIPYSTDSC